jgi:hypothetical protein
MKILEYLTFTFLSLSCFVPLQSAVAYDATLSLGNLCEYVGKIQSDDSGATNLCSFNPYLSASIDYPINNQIILSPEMGFSFPKKGRDPNISKNSFFALLNTKYKLSMFEAIGGVGFFFSRISGSGGTQDLNNGSSTVSFPMPESTALSRNFILNIGLGAEISPSWSADLHTYIFNMLTSEDRAFSIAINGTYHFGEFQ